MPTKRKILSVATPPPLKRFGGENYRFRSWEVSKSVAQSDAQMLRKMGFKARVTKVSSLTGYMVYVRG